ncbi:MAG: hypothetical protein GXW85_03945 [Clostridia bacterium]|nr:hypothetical protein [Clostridia bacterium]
MIFSTFLVVIFSILFGMYLGFRWAKGDDIYLDLTNFFSRIKRTLKRILS